MKACIDEDGLTVVERHDGPSFVRCPYADKECGEWCAKLKETENTIDCCGTIHNKK